MLQTQVNYWTNEENKRSHLANEAIQWAQNQENIRHNLITEGLSADSLAETRRHALVSEMQNQSSVNIARKSYKETVRANKEREHIQRFEMKESQRSHKVQEFLTSQSNEIGFANVGLGYSNLAENTRAHKASETLESYSNWTNRFLGTRNAATNAQQADTAARKQTLAEQEFDWNKTKYLDYDYDLARKKITQGYVSSGLGFASNLIDTAAKIVTRTKAKR